MMLWKLLWYIFGYYRIAVSIRDREAAVIALYPSGVKHIGEKKHRDIYYFDFKKADAEKAKDTLSSAGIELTGEREYGAVNYLRKYRLRPGIAVGIVLVFISVFVSGRFLWSIEFKGLDCVSEDRALELLEKHGIYVGCYIPALELRELYNEILMDCDEFSWISVNIRGTHASVEVRESEGKTRMTPPDGKCANLVSRFNAEITAVRVYSGERAVSIGDGIKEGELLISGLYEDKMGRLVHKYAQGEIWGKFTQDFEVRIPLNYEKKVYTGEVFEDVTLKIFSNSINIFKFSRNIDTEYDIITSNEHLCLFDSVTLPVFINRETHLGYAVEDAVRDENTARDIAYASMGREIRSLVGNGEILSLEYEGLVENGEYVLKAQVTLNTNIARVQEFIYNEG